jgi:hypothetical protein
VADDVTAPVDDVERPVEPVATDVDGDGDTNKADAAGETVAHAGGLDPMAVAALALSWMPLVGVVLGFVSFTAVLPGTV